VRSKQEHKSKTTIVYLVISFLYFNGYMFRSCLTKIRPSYNSYS